MLLSTSQLSKKNDQEARNIDVIFSSKQLKKKELEELQQQLNVKKRAIDNVVDGMEEDLLSQYQVLNGEINKIKKVISNTVVACKLKV